MCLSTHSYSQSPNPMAQLVSLEHSCGDKLGSVEFELLGNPEDFTYYWAHGPIALNLENLLAGTYTFIVKNIYGCEEEYEIDILDLTQCEAITTITDGSEPCIKVITIQILSNGIPIPIESIIIEWDDNPNETGLVRYINTANYVGGVIICAEISTSFMEEICCTTQVCAYLTPEPPCGQKIISDQPGEEDETIAVVDTTESIETAIQKSKNVELVNNDNNVDNLRSEKELKNSLTVYPNPFLNEFVIKYHSIKVGEASMSIYTIHSELITSKKWNSDKGDQFHTIVAGDNLSPGIYILKFSFPSGEDAQKRIIRVASN